MQRRQKNVQKSVMHVQICCFASLKVMLHETIRNDDFYLNTALLCWNNVVPIQNNVSTMLQRCVSLKIVVASRLV